MKEIIIIVGIFILTGCGVSKEEYSKLAKENDSLKVEIEELKNGEERLSGLINNSYKNKDYKLVKQTISKIKRLHPNSSKMEQFEKMLIEIEKYELAEKKRLALAEKERILKENYNNTGKWYVLNGYYIEYSGIRGKFGNNATEDSQLLVNFRVTKSLKVEIKLYEYASNNPLKATSASPQEYYVSYWHGKRKSDGLRTLSSCWAVNSNDHLSVDSKGSRHIHKLLSKGESIDFSISGTGYNESSKYKFTLGNIEWYENAIRKLKEK